MCARARPANCPSYLIEVEATERKKKQEQKKILLFIGYCLELGAFGWRELPLPQCDMTMRVLRVYFA